MTEDRGHTSTDQLVSTRDEADFFDFRLYRRVHTRSSGDPAGEDPPPDSIRRDRWTSMKTERLSSQTDNKSVEQL